MDDTKLPGLLLAIVGGLTIFAGLGLIVLGIISIIPIVSAEAWAALATPIVYAVMGFGNIIGGAISILGGLKARNMESKNLAMAGAVMACLPFCSACCMPLGLGVGIWNLVVINKLKDQFNS